jgi:soluble P-type ATPase
MIFWLQVEIENQNIAHQKDQTESATLNGIDTLNTTGKQRETLDGFLVVTVVVADIGSDQLILTCGDLGLVVIDQMEIVHQKFQRMTHDRDLLLVVDQVV